MVVFFDGLDNTKELVYMRGVAELVRRGMSCLVVDGPGSGEAARFRDLSMAVTMMTSLNTARKSRTVRSIRRSPPTRRKALFFPILVLLPPERMMPVMRSPRSFHV